MTGEDGKIREDKGGRYGIIWEMRGIMRENTGGLREGYRNLREKTGGYGRIKGEDMGD
jgi:hypothetical protein